ncbi:ABC transporter permease [Streptomyces sp. UNOC14_S4]|uniref:ABC transporter permease n=1 Tax=Streptomyces sp. UNOC14_S4 TaxID=2872340 RepID=UPI001E608465|nr:ABC transporter permease [Streptomyces sp. UNOC14_S4]MCC3767480.1 ABC transporter permease [Streptomyces sp. UNOC14_S4]
MATTTADATPRSTSISRVVALGRAELTLLGRSKTALYMGLLMPAVMIYAMHSAIGGANLDKTGMSVAEVSMTGGFGFVLVFAVYQNLVTAYVARREELVLKRLRTGEAGDLEILAGTAVPAVIVALVQCVLLVAAGVVWLKLGMVERPELLLAGLISGIALCILLAGATAAWAKSVEGAGFVTTPMFLITMLGSGLVVPLEIMPDGLARVCELLPLTPAMQLMRGGWLGGMSAGDAIQHLVTALVWVALGVFAVRRWFRWEPRR